MNCVCCESETRPLTMRDAFKGNPLEECASCAHVQLRENPNADDIGRYYATSYSRARGKLLSHAYFEIMKKRARAQWRYVRENMGAEAALERVSDVGCGYGAFVELAGQQVGVRLSRGYEMDPVAVEHCRSRNLDVCAIASEMDYCEIAECDLVVLSHTVEHMLNPVGSLTRLRGRCGWLFMEVPYYRSEMTSLFSDQEGHLNFFNETSLRLLLERMRFRIIDVQRCGPDADSWWAEGLLRRCLKQLRTTLHRDIFWNKYGVQSPSGMWIRALVKS